MEAHLARIEALNSKVNAFITVTRTEARQQARAAEKEIAAGHYRGPMHGIPYAPKDIIATKGIRTTNGSRVTADWVPGYESAVTARLTKPLPHWQGQLPGVRHGQRHLLRFGPLLETLGRLTIRPMAPPAVRALPSRPV